MASTTPGAPVLAPSRRRPSVGGFVRLALLPLVVLGVGCDSSSGLLDPENELPGEFFDHPSYQILFISDRDGGSIEGGPSYYDIYLMGANGVENLTNDPAQIYSEWHLSPDGSRLVMRSNRSGCDAIWTMAVDGSDQTKLTGTNDRCNIRPQWSPDGSMIAFSSSRVPEWGWEVWVMDADGSNPTNVSQNLGWDGSPKSNMMHRWTPDGRIVFDHQPSGEWWTYAVNPDGSDLEPMFEEGSYRPFWSPDGSRVLFFRDGQTHIANGDGSDPEPLFTGYPGHGAQPSWDPWSPDGSRLVVSEAASLDGNHIYVMNPDGSGVVNITDYEAQHRFMGWSPDGSLILFSSDREGAFSLYMVSPDGTGLQRLTDLESSEPGGIWVPRI